MSAIKDKTYQCLNCGEESQWRYEKVNKYCSNRCQANYQTKQKIDKWLAEDVAPGKGVMKRYVMEQQENRCAICDMEDEWIGKPLVFVMDHIDGDSSNNSRDNLRCVCPNCDTQLDTFKSKNRGNGRHWRKQRYADGKSY